MKKKGILYMKSVMTPFPYTVDLDASIDEAGAMMEEHGIHHLPVADGVKTLNHVAVLVNHLGIGVDHHAALGSEITRVDPHGVERRLVHRPQAGIGGDPGVAVVTVVGGLAAVALEGARLDDRAERQAPRRQGPQAEIEEEETLAHAPHQSDSSNRPAVTTGRPRC